MNATAKPDAENGDPIEALRDFPDRLSPILVKELRQGLRQPSFVIMFLFLQGVMAMAVISALCAVSSSSLSHRVEMGTMISGSFFALFGLAVIAVQPMRALAALSTEIRDNTIDLLLLTRLDSWRIVVGKWLCLITQSALLLVAIMPYLMMRYFLGGMNLFLEMGMLTLLFLFGAMVCAGGVGMSAVRSVILRTIFAIAGVIGFIIMLQGFGMMFVFSSMGSRASSPLTSIGFGALDWTCLIIGIVLLLSFLTFSFLEFAATRIAPPSENRSRRKRLIAIAALLVIPAILTIPDFEHGVLCHLALLLIAPICMADALSESPKYVRPASGWELPLLRPGWPCGALFALVVTFFCALWQILLALCFEDGSSDMHLTMAQTTAMCLLLFSQPPLLVSLLRARDSEPANLYLTIILGSITLGMVLMVVAAVADSHEMICTLLFAFLPILGFGTLDDPSIGITVAAFLCTVLYLMAAAAIGIVKWRPIPIPVAAPTPPKT